MSHLARRCTDLVLTTLEVRVGAAQALTSEAYALACEQGVGLEGLDHDVLTDRLLAASVHLSTLIAAMLPEGQDDAAAIATVASRHRPRVRHHGSDPRRYLADLIHAATRYATSAGRLVKRFECKPESRVAKLISAARSNLRIAGYLVEGPRRADPTIEAVVHECREVVRRRRGGEGDVTAV